jgi:hypothetical protein
MRRVTLFLVVLMVLGLCGVVSAADTDSINLLVTPGYMLSVNIVEASYDFGTVDLGATTVSTQAVSVNTNGANINQKLRFTCANSSAWNVGATASDNIFAMYGYFATSQPTSGWIQITSAGTYVDSNETDVPKDTTKYLWFKLGMPTSSSTSEQQTIAFTVKGVVAQ